MFVVSLSSKKLRIVCLTAFCCIIISIVAGMVLYKYSKTDALNTELSVNNSASDINEIAAFISNFGWEIKEEPDEIREIIIPVEFDDVYSGYNEIQLSQGYDLREYSGEKAKNWTFTVLNYPGYENQECIKINVLVYNGNVIGGDVCSVKLDGFMHGFAKE